MNFFYIKNINKGFTLIETMIATSLFLVVMVVGVSALISANSVSNRTDNERAVLDNVSFVLEEISRNLRTGSAYHCEVNGDPLSNPETPKSCSLGYLVAFEDTRGDETKPLDQWVYKIDAGVAGLVISKSIDSGASWIELLSEPNLEIDSASGFSVLGALPPPDDTQQPFVVVRIAGKIIGKDGSTPFSVQTSVSQRLLDI